MKENKERNCRLNYDDLPLEERIGLELFMVHSGIRARKNRDFEEIGLTSRQADVLLYIYGHESTENIQQVDIERVFQLSNPTVTGIIQRLESKGFLTREVSQADKRCKFLHCTEQAKTIHEHAVRKRSESNAILTQGFSEEEKKQLSDLLMKSIDNLRRHNETEN